MSNLATTITVLAGIAALLGLQGFWIKSYLDARLDDIAGQLAGIREDLRSIEGLLHDHGERIARLEARP